MTNQSQYYESFPLYNAIMTNIFNLLSFIIGSLILTGFHFWFGVGYFLFCILTLLYAMKIRCASCYYYGKLCAAGYGKLVPLLFSKKDVDKFHNTVNYVMPMVSLPILGAIILLIINFNMTTLNLLAAYLFVTVARTIIPKLSNISSPCLNCQQKNNCSIGEKVSS